LSAAIRSLKLVALVLLGAAAAGCCVLPPFGHGPRGGHGGYYQGQGPQGGGQWGPGPGGGPRYPGR